MSFRPELALEYLRRARDHRRLGHAYLLTGPGEATWTLACQLTALVNNLPASAPPETVLAHPDVHLVEPESKSRRILIEQIRTLEGALHLRAGVGGESGRKVAILRDADRLVPQAANAFLKTLEEPPSQSLLLLLSAQPELMLETILSRCIRVNLLDPEAVHPARRAAEEPENAALLAALGAHAADAKPSLPAAYRVLKEFQNALSAARARLSADADTTLAAEEKRYAQTTDSGKDYVEERENALKAQTEARYAGERERLLGLLLAWWGDALRLAGAGPDAPPDLPPAVRPGTVALAERLSPTVLLRKLGRLETLREHLGRNVQEALALEVAFLEVFGA